MDFNVFGFVLLVSIGNCHKKIGLEIINYEATEDNVIVYKFKDGTKMPQFECKLNVKEHAYNYYTLYWIFEDEYGKTLNDPVEYPMEVANHTIKFVDSVTLTAANNNNKLICNSREDNKHGDVYSLQIVFLLSDTTEKDFNSIPPDDDGQQFKAKGYFLGMDDGILIFIVVSVVCLLVVIICIYLFSTNSKNNKWRMHRPKKREAKVHYQDVQPTDNRELPNSDSGYYSTVGTKKSVVQDATYSDCIDAVNAEEAYAVPVNTLKLTNQSTVPTVSTDLYSKVVGKSLKSAQREPVTYATVLPKSMRPAPEVLYAEIMLSSGDREKSQHYANVSDDVKGNQKKVYENVSQNQYAVIEKINN